MEYPFPIVSGENSHFRTKLSCSSVPCKFSACYEYWTGKAQERNIYERACALFVCAEFWKQIHSRIAQTVSSWREYWLIQVRELFQGDDGQYGFKWRIFLLLLDEKRRKRRKVCVLIFKKPWKIYIKEGIIITASRWKHNNYKTLWSWYILCSCHITKSYNWERRGVRDEWERERGMLRWLFLLSLYWLPPASKCVLCTVQAVLSSPERCNGHQWMRCEGKSAAWTNIERPRRANTDEWCCDCVSAVLRSLHKRILVTSDTRRSYASVAPCPQWKVETDVSWS